MYLVPSYSKARWLPAIFWFLPGTDFQAGIRFRFYILQSWKQFLAGAHAGNHWRTVNKCVNIKSPAVTLRLLSTGNLSNKPPLRADCIKKSTVLEKLTYSTAEILWYFAISVEIISRPRKSRETVPSSAVNTVFAANKTF